MHVVLLHVDQVVSDEELYGLNVVLVFISALNQASAGGIEEKVRTFEVHLCL